MVDRLITSYFNTLSAEQTTLLILRLLTSCVAFVCLLSALISPLSNNESYMIRIDCARLNIEAGLSATLKNNLLFNSDSFYDGSPFAATLTTSDLNIIAEYSQDQVKDAPQYITVSLWKWCRGDYNETEAGDSKYLEQHESLTCYDSNSDVLYDYVDLFNSVGLTFIELYAYNDSENETHSYAETVLRRQRTYKFVPFGIIVSTVLSFTTFILTIFIYAKDKHSSSSSFILLNPKVVRTKKTSFTSLAFLNFTAIVSTVSFVSIMTAVALLSAVLNQLEREINRQLASFGIALHLGKIWFILLYVGCVSSLLCTLLWMFPLWCGNPSRAPEISVHDDDIEPARLSSPEELPEDPKDSDSDGNGNNDHNENGNDMNSPDENENEQQNNDEESEWEIRLVGNQPTEHQLRKLGHMLTKSARKTDFNIMTRSSLYSNDSESIHYQESIYNGYTDENPFTSTALSRGGNSSSGNQYNSTSKNETLELDDLDRNNSSGGTNTNSKRTKKMTKSTTMSLDGPITSIMDVLTDRFDSGRINHNR
ncbi:hypothetical protein DFJ63DRAFT_310982 [Scheffersomyces coipomensis]|uniref:uncharacterized protein n=1 Tax=Scheffersomyces coipomensis TaxID=1788519 RepID=UPI00315C6950